MEDPIYLDHAATSPISETALSAMAEAYRVGLGNPSSVHAAGRKARGLLEDARSRVAEHWGVAPNEIVFTSGATEANLLAVLGVMRAVGGRFVTSSIEHKAVLNAANRVQDLGFEVLFLKPREDGVIDPVDLERALGGAGHGLVSLMHINNELGAINPIIELARIARRAGFLFHTDAVQSVGQHSQDLLHSAINYWSFSSHKLGGPLGLGGLVVRGGSPLLPLMSAGGQERSRRGGTENAPAVVGLATQLEFASSLPGPPNLSIIAKGLREVMGSERVRESIPPSSRAGHILSLALIDENGDLVNSDMLMTRLARRGLYVSAGSACNAGVPGASPVLTKIGLSRSQAEATIRLSSGYSTSPDSLRAALVRMSGCLDRKEPS